jgi:3-hydroxyisobutyrate dehydrogenase-like beta-hydroxyacid dehydrogenase
MGEGDHRTVIGYRRHMVDDFILMGGIPATSSREVAQRSDIIITCLSEDDALIEAIMGQEGVIHGAHRDLVVVDIGMLSIEAKEQARHALKQVGVHMLDCPISGVPPMVLAKKTVLFASGDRATFEACMPVFESIAGNTFYIGEIGEFGAGSKIKCITNLLVAIHVLATAEAMALSAKAGLDAETVIRVISPSIASSTQFVTRAPAMTTGHFEPPMSTIHQIEECIVIIKKLAESVNGTKPLLDTAAQYYEQAIAAGLENKDVAAVISVLENSVDGKND